MTATTTSSNNKTSFFNVRFKNKFSEDMKLFITNLLFQLLCLPVLAGVALRVLHMEHFFKEHNLSYYDSSECLPFIVIAVIAFILSIGMGLIIPMVNFKYLYNKSLVDMNYSLPLSNRQRFFADFATGLITYVLPALIGAAIGGIELFIGSQFVDLSEISDEIPQAVQAGFAVIVGMILLYSVCVFAITFAGSMFEAIFSIFAVNIMIPVVIGLTWVNIVDAAHFGLVDGAVLESYPFFTTSPIGVFAFIIFFMENGVSTLNYYNGYELSSSFVNSSYFNFMVRTIIISAVFVIVSYLLYKHRKAEDVSKPYVYNAFYYIIMSLAVYSIVSALKLTDVSSAMFAAFIISGIIWFVMELIRRRGFKRFWTAVISFGAASLAVIGVIKLIDVTQGLGAAKVIPNASAVTDVEINTWGGAIDCNSQFLIRDKHIINDVIDINKEVVDRHFNYSNYDYNISDYKTNSSMYYDDYSEENRNDKKVFTDQVELRITYYTGSGSTIQRNYYVPSQMLTQLFCDVNSSEEYAEMTARTMKRDCAIRKDYKNPNEISGYEFVICNKLGHGENVRLSVSEGEELISAVRSDIIAMSSDEFRNAEFYCTINGTSINSAFTNTVRFLDMHDIQYNKTPAQLVDDLISSGNIITMTENPEYVFPLAFFKNISSDSNNLLSYNYEEMGFTNECATLDGILVLNSHNNDRGYISYSRGYMQFDDIKAAEKLIEVAVPVVFDQIPIAEISGDGYTLYIPDEPGNREIIDKAIKTISFYNYTTNEKLPINVTEFY